MHNITKFMNIISEKECAIIFSSVNRRFLSNFLSTDGYLYVTSSKAVLFLDSRYYEMAQIAQKCGQIPDEIELKNYGFTAEINDMLSSGEADTLLYEDRRLTCADLESYKNRFTSARFLPLGTKLESLRECKSQNELELLISAQRISEKAFEHILEFISPKRTEKETALELEFYMRSHGAENVSFDTICVSGKKTSMPHGRPEAITLTPDAFVTMDFGCIFEGYCSDMTRTVVLGHASEEMKKIYDIVLAAQTAAISKVKAGVIGKKVDEAARELISEAGYKDAFRHSTGHGVGLEIHESPLFAPSYDKPVPAGAVLSVEPGIYLPDKFGVRIEDVVYVTDNGCIDITKCEKKLIEL